MAAQHKTSWYASFFNFLPKKNQKKKKKPSPSARTSRRQIAITLGITFVIVSGIAGLENILKDENPQAAISPKLSTKNPQIIELIEAYNQNELRKEENKKCKYKFYLLTWLICPLSDSKLLGQVQNIGVLAAAILFLFDTFDRKKQLERQAWQLIDGAQGSETSGARKQAIEDLYKEGADITGLDADGADLREINLSGADLTRASFKNAILEKANFEGATLEGANFTGANLKGANFKKAVLLGAIFTRADLRAFFDEKTDLRDADLGFTTFNRAKLGDAIFGMIDSEPDLGNKTNLNGAKLRGVNLKNVNLNKVCIAQAKLGGAIIEDLETIRNAEEYKEAYYSKDFYDVYNDEIKYVDVEYYQDPEFQQLTTQKIVEISQRLLSKKSLSLQDQDEESLSDFVNLLNHLVILVKESDNECFIDDEKLSDKVLELKRSIQESEKFQQDGLKMIKDNENFIQQAKNELDELDKLDRMKNINKQTEQ